MMELDVVRIRRALAQAIATALLLILTANQLVAQISVHNPFEGINVEMDVNDADGVLYNGQSIQAFLRFQNSTETGFALEIEWRFETDDWRPLKQIKLPVVIKRATQIQAYSPLFLFPGPGFYRISATARSTNGDQRQWSKVIGVDPEKISSPANPQPDFDTFWESSIKELSSVAPDYKVSSQKRDGDSKTSLYRVEMKSFGGLSVRGWLEVPKKKGIYPALIRVPGFTGNMEPIDVYDDLIVFSFNPRDHGESDDTGNRGFDMWVRGLESKKSYFYRGLYLDCIRAVDFLASRPDVDPDRIAIWGGSQGGGLSFATAALDQRISLCIADIPFLSDWQRYFEITHWDEVDTWFQEHPEQTWKSMLQTLSYFDTKNMADRIRCHVMMGIGLQDDVCPPATSFVTFNKIKSQKEYTIYKDEGHSQPESHYQNRFMRLRELFDMN